MCWPAEMIVCVHGFTLSVSAVDRGWYLRSRALATWRKEQLHCTSSFLYKHIGLMIYYSTWYIHWPLRVKYYNDANSHTLNTLLPRSWGWKPECVKMKTQSPAHCTLSSSCSESGRQENRLKNKPNITVRLSDLERKPGGERGDANWPCGLLLTRPAKHFAAEVYDSGWLQEQLISSSCDSRSSIWGTSTWMTIHSTQNTSSGGETAMVCSKRRNKCSSGDSHCEVRNTHIPWAGKPSGTGSTSRPAASGEILRLNKQNFQLTMMLKVLQIQRSSTAKLGPENINETRYKDDNSAMWSSIFQIKWCVLQ